MALSSEQKKLRQKEARIGRKAAQIATQHLKRRIDQTFELKNEGGFFRDKKVAPMLESSKVKAKMGEHVLLGLDATSNRYAFIHHYGFKGTRSSAFIRYSHSRFTAQFTQRKEHLLDIKERSVFSELYIRSGAVDYLFEQLSQTRAESFQIKFNDLITKLSSNE